MSVGDRARLDNDRSFTLRVDNLYFLLARCQFRIRLFSLYFLLRGGLRQNFDFQRWLRLLGLRAHHELELVSRCRHWVLARQFTLQLLGLLTGRHVLIKIEVHSDHHLGWML